MEEKIVKDGTKIILFALDTEDTSVAGWSLVNYGWLLDNLMRKDFEVVPNKFIITLNNGTEYHPRVANKFSNFCCSSVFYGDQKRAQFISCQHWYLLQQKRKVERM